MSLGFHNIVRISNTNLEEQNESESPFKFLRMMQSGLSAGLVDEKEVVDKNST